MGPTGLRRTKVFGCDLTPPGQQAEPGTEMPPPRLYELTRGLLEDLELGDPAYDRLLLPFDVAGTYFAVRNGERVEPPRAEPGEPLRQEWWLARIPVYRRIQTDFQQKVRVRLEPASLLAERGLELRLTPQETAGVELPGGREWDLPPGTYQLEVTAPGLHARPRWLRFLFQGQESYASAQGLVARRLIESSGRTAPPSLVGAFQLEIVLNAEPLQQLDQGRDGADADDQERAETHEEAHLELLDVAAELDVELLDVAPDPGDLTLDLDVELLDVALDLGDLALDFDRPELEILLRRHPLLQDRDDGLDLDLGLGLRHPGVPELLDVGVGVEGDGRHGRPQ
jgi:hypothetical protein